jgi:flagellar motility protein MotE (MotC chaperone)
MKIRLLPVTMFVAALLFSVKIGDMWTGTAGTGQAVQIAESRAQETDEDASDTASADEADDEDAAEADMEADAEGEDEEEDVDLDALAAETPLIDAAPELTQAEIDVLQTLRERRQALDAREAEIDMRESMLKAAEVNLESRIDEWKRLQADVEQLLTRYEEAQDDELKTLATYYEKMKPKDAARVFNTLDLPYLIEIVGRMKEAKVAVVIGKMDTQKAKTLTMELARRSETVARSDAPQAQ